MWFLNEFVIRTPLFTRRIANLSLCTCHFTLFSASHRELVTCHLSLYTFFPRRIANSSLATRHSLLLFEHKKNHPFLSGL